MLGDRDIYTPADVSFANRGIQMLERHMEELIAKYPDEFFPGKGFTLIGRQVSFPDAGRFDLLFSDRHQRRNLMELKAQALKIADADQVGRYRTALREQGEKRIILWLVATRIPTHVRESLDDLGIEYAEIHVAQFKRVAEEHGLVVDEPSALDKLVNAPHRREAIRQGDRMTMHERIRTAIEPYRGDSLTAAKITELVLTKFPDTNRTSLCISGHSDSPAPSNQGWCCQGTDAQLLQVVERGLYKVLHSKEKVGR